MNCSGNLTNCMENEYFLRNTSFLVYSCVFIAFLIGIGLFVLLTCFSLNSASAMPLSIRIYLSNLLVAGFLVSSVCILFLASCIFLALSDTPKEDLFIPFCSVALWVFGTGAVARLWNLAAFSVVVYLIIRCGPKSAFISKAKFVVPTVATLWVGSAIVNIHIPLPYVYSVQYAGGAACFPYYDDIPVIPRYAFTASWMIFGGIAPLAVSIVMPGICLYYVKHNSVSQNTAYNKSMARFTLFLVVSSVINISGQTIPGVVAFFAQEIGIYLTYSLVVLSLLPTPLLIVIFLKPVRFKMQEFTAHTLCLSCKKKHSISLSASTLNSKVSTV